MWKIMKMVWTGFFLAFAIVHFYLSGRIWTLANEIATNPYLSHHSTGYFIISIGYGSLAVGATVVFGLLLISQIIALKQRLKALKDRMVH